MITHYLSSKYIINSKDKFLQIVRTIQRPGTLTSLDVESPFTNVPVLYNINIIADNVYHHPGIPPPPCLPCNIFQKTSIGMHHRMPISTHRCDHEFTTGWCRHGFTLGRRLANFYMCNLENNIFQTQPSLKPTIYCRCIDIFIVTPNIQQLQLLKDSNENNSILKITTEIGFNNKINFLDVDINNSHEHVVTNPFVKPTN